MTISKKSKALFALPVSVFLCATVQASHHFEAASFLTDTRLAQVDNFIFPSDKKGNTTIIMTVNYDPKFGANQTFHPYAIYNIHLASNEDLNNGTAYSIQFNNDNYTVFELDSSNALPGTIGKKIGSGKLDQVGQLGNGVRGFAGIIKDPFFGNSNSLIKYREENDKGEAYNPNIWKEADGKSIFLGRTVGAIVLDIPNKRLGNEIRAFFTTDLKENGKWKQVQYSAIPLLSHSMLMNSDTQKKIHDSSRPSEEYNKDLKKIISATILRATTLANKTNTNLVQYADQTAETLVPDVIPYKVGTPAIFSLNKINGRALGDDIMTVMLTKLFGEHTDQAIKNPKAYESKFPFVIPVKSLKK